jgi:RNA polymerase sigma factor (TIGR02999 family)
MTEPSITQLIAQWRDGDGAALEALAPLLYDNLRQIASRHMSKENAWHTLSPTAVVHEAYLRLQGYQSAPLDRAHFLALAAREMRRVLVDHARRLKSQKRGGEEWQRVTLTDYGDAAETKAIDILAIEEALTRLAAIDERKARIVDLMIFGGLTADETAEAMEISSSTVNREWRLARAFLQSELKP